MQKYSKGPWKIEVSTSEPIFPRGQRERYAKIYSEVNGERYYVTGRIYFEDDETWANLNLMSAAPELLDGCNQALDEIVEQLDNGISDPVYRHLHELLLRVTGKALGSAKMPGYEINREIVFSTSHITEHENDILKSEASTNVSAIAVDDIEFGYRIWVDQDKANFNSTPNILSLVRASKAMGCKWLVLDCDGPVVNNLRTFDW